MEISLCLGSIDSTIGQTDVRCSMNGRRRRFPTRTCTIHGGGSDIRIRCLKSASLVTIINLPSTPCCQTEESVGLFEFSATCRTGNAHGNRKSAGRSHPREFRSCDFPDHKMMSHQPTRKPNRLPDVFLGQTRILARDLGGRIAGPEKLQDRLHRDARPLESRLTVTDLGADHDLAHPLNLLDLVVPSIPRPALDSRPRGARDNLPPAGESRPRASVVSHK
jgi:hypothetical protein